MSHKIRRLIFYHIIVDVLLRWLGDAKLEISCEKASIKNIYLPIKKYLYNLQYNY